MLRLDRVQSECQDAKVITDKMLVTAVRATLSRKELESVDTQREFLYKNIPYVRLNCCNISKVSHLQRLENLVKLELNSNMITHISGLFHLTKLKYLDLSFNNIHKIEGLSSLVLLEELSLFQNKISVVENLTQCNKLMLLSLGRNRLADLENTALYLRKLPNLRSLNLMENPLCKDPTYKVYLLALCDKLYYLDYYKVNPDDKVAADKEHAVLKYNLTTSEAKAAEKEEVERQNKARLQSYVDAHVDNFHSGILFDMMISADNDTRIYQQIPGAADLLDELKERVDQMCKQLFRLGFDNHNRRTEEKAEFDKCVEKTLENIRQKSYAATEEFVDFKNELEDRVKTDYMSVNEDQAVKNYRDKLKKLENSLLYLEAFLIDQLDELEKDFERNLRDISGPIIEQTQHQFAMLRDYMENYYVNLTEQCENARKRLDVLFPENIAIRKHFADKDTIVNLISTSREANMLVVDSQEDKFLTHINDWIDNHMEEIHAKLDDERNREAVLEITRMTENFTDTLAVLFPQTML